MASTFLGSHPSEKFGTHSTSVDIGEKNSRARVTEARLSAESVVSQQSLLGRGNSQCALSPDFASHVFSILGYTKALRFSIPIDSIFVQVPSTHPCLLHRHPAAFAEIFLPTALCCAVTSLHHSRPIRYAGHSERVLVLVCKKISENGVGDIAGAGVAPVVSDLIFRSCCFGEL